MSGPGPTVSVGETFDARFPTPVRLFATPGIHLLLDEGARGPVLTVSTACASGSTTMGLGADLLRDDRADLVVAGGVR